jgi:hypothetical protein
MLMVNMLTTCRPVFWVHKWLCAVDTRTENLRLSSSMKRKLYQFALPTKTKKGARNGASTSVTRLASQAGRATTHECTVKQIASPVQVSTFEKMGSAHHSWSANRPPREPRDTGIETSDGPVILI